MRILFIILLVVANTFALKDTILSSGKWSALTWSTGAVPQAGDTVYRTGGYHDTMDADYSITAFFSYGTDAGNHIRTGQKLTVTGSNGLVYQDSGSGLRHYGNNLTISGDNAKAISGIAINKLTIDACSLVVSGNKDTFDLQAAGLGSGIWKYVDFAAVGCTTTTGTINYRKAHIGAGYFRGLESKDFVSCANESGRSLVIDGATNKLFFGGSVISFNADAGVKDTLDTIKTERVIRFQASGGYYYVPNKITCESTIQPMTDIYFECDTIIALYLVLRPQSATDTIHFGNTHFKILSDIYH